MGQELVRTTVSFQTYMQNYVYALMGSLLGREFTAFRFSEVPMTHRSLQNILGGTSLIKAQNTSPNLSKSLFFNCSPVA